MISHDFAELYKRDLTRLRQEVEGLTDDTAWQTAPGMNNSPGNLILHLEGNLREYIGRQMGGLPYQRHRDAEFSSKGATVQELRERVQGLIETIPPVIAAVDLSAQHQENIIGKTATRGQILASLLGHFNYHLGQIDSARRAFTNAGPVTFAGL